MLDTHVLHQTQCEQDEGIKRRSKLEGLGMLVGIWTSGTNDSRREGPCMPIAYRNLAGRGTEVGMT